MSLTASGPGGDQPADRLRRATSPRQPSTRARAAARREVAARRRTGRGVGRGPGGRRAARPARPARRARGSAPAARGRRRHLRRPGSARSREPGMGARRSPLVVEERTWSGARRGARAARAALREGLIADFYGSTRHDRAWPAPARRLVLGHQGYVHATCGRATDAAAEPPRHRRDRPRPRPRRRVVRHRRPHPGPVRAGYALENRRVISRVVPELYRRSPMRRLRRTCRRCGRRSSPRPARVDAPSAVLLSPGPDSETAFDQAFVATLLGLPLVEGRDLTVRDGRVWLRALGRLEPVDVILRRVDGSWCDPLELRPESRLGVPGLLGGGPARDSRHGQRRRLRR